MLVANISDEITVTDTDGGIWRPTDEAAAEIMSAADPEAKAVEICETAPMRGTWKQ